MTTVRDGIHFERKPGDKVKITNVAFDGVRFLHPDQVRAKDERIAELEEQVAQRGQVCANRFDRIREQQQTIVVQAQEIARLREGVEQLTNLDRVNARDIKTMVRERQKALDEATELRAENDRLTAENNHFRLCLMQEEMKLTNERDEARDTVARQMGEIASLREGHEVQAGTISDLHDAIKRLASQRDNLHADLDKLCGVLALFYWFTVERTDETIRLTPKGHLANYYQPTTILRAKAK